MADKISNAYGFDEVSKADLQRSIDESQTFVKVKTNNDPLNQQLVAAFARSIDSMSSDDKKKILEIVNGNK